MKIKFEIELFEGKNENQQNESKEKFSFKNQLRENIEDVLITVADKTILAAKKAKKSLNELSILVAENNEANLNETALEKQNAFFEYLDKKGYKVNNTGGNINIAKEAQTFLKMIEYPAGSCSKIAFERAHELSEITYEAIVKNVKRYFLEFSEEQIEKILKYDFNQWKNQNNFPDAEFVDLFEYFVSKLKEAK